MTAFGSVFMPKMVITRYEDGAWSDIEVVDSDQLTLHPAAHVLHYASTCFEGLKAFRHDDGSVNLFRMGANIARMAKSSELLMLPPIDEVKLAAMIRQIVLQFADQVPAPPGSMYIRPTHLGSEPSIGKAAAPSTTSLLYVILSPVGDYFAAGSRSLRVLVEPNAERCAAHMGRVKSGGNYASALQPIMAARHSVQADQVLFCPGGDVQETGAANFLLIDGNEIITKALDSTFLHGITRDSILSLARDQGMVVSERALPVAELIERAKEPGTEAALSGTAAVLAPVGTLIYEGQEITVGSGQEGPATQKLRESLNAIQWGKAPDNHGWVERLGD
jgi:branched-chain amino acid aminotransferase